jgi:choline-sulfatase
VFSSDHGELNGDHGLIYKSTFLDGAVRVPLLVRTPETLGSATAGTVSDCPVEWFDIGPTLVECAGGTLGHQQFARSLMPVLRDPTAHHRDWAVSEIDGELMYRDRQWKMMLNAQGRPYRLFDLENDPRETLNLVADGAAEALIRELRIRVQEQLVRTQVYLNG